MNRRLTLLIPLLLLAAWTLAGPYPDQPSQAIREEFWIYNADGSLKTSGSVRGYVVLADSSEAVNQFDLTFDPAADSSWYLLSPRRDTRLDLYRIDGADSLVRANVPVSGLLSGQAAVDDSALATEAVTTRAILDSTILAGDIASSALETRHYGDATLTGPKLYPQLVNRGVTAQLGTVKIDSLILGFPDSAIAGRAVLYTADGKRAYLMIPATPAADSVAFRIPNNNGSANWVLERTTDGGAAWDDDIQLGTLVVVDGTTFGSLTGSDSDSLLSGLLSRFRRRLVIGGNGEKGVIRLLRHGYYQDIIPGELEDGDGNAVFMLPYTAGTPGDVLEVGAVAGDTTKTNWTTPATQKWEWAGQKTWTENSDTWQYFVISGMNAPDCYDPSTTASWPVLITPTYFAGVERRFSGYVSNDTLTVEIPSATSTDWKLNIYIRESD